MYSTARHLRKDLVNRWLSVRFNLLSAAIMAVTGIVAVLNGNISASLAGFSLTFANTIMGDMLFMVGTYPVCRIGIHIDLSTIFLCRFVVSLGWNSLW
jgi:hypothetical protein